MASSVPNIWTTDGHHSSAGCTTARCAALASKIVWVLASTRWRRASKSCIRLAMKLTKQRLFKYMVIDRLHNHRSLAWKRLTFLLNGVYSFKSEAFGEKSSAKMVSFPFKPKSCFSLKQCFVYWSNWLINELIGLYRHEVHLRKTFPKMILLLFPLS